MEDPTQTSHHYIRRRHAKLLRPDTAVGNSNGAMCKIYYLLLLLNILFSDSYLFYFIFYFDALVSRYLKIK